MKKLLLGIILISFQVNAQFSESFEGALTAPSGWTILNAGSPNTWVGADLAASAGLQAQNGTKVFTIAFNAAAHDDYLVTPQFVVTAGVTDRISFWARSRDAAYPETIDVKVSTTTATSAAFTTVIQANVAPPSGANFIKYTVDLTSLIGQNIFVGFHSTTTDKFAFDIDNVVLGSINGCVEPTTVPTVSSIGATTATLDWTAASPDPASGYDIYYSTIGTAPTDATTATASVGSGITTYNITGLTQATKYYIYIRSNCGGSKSVWGHLLVFNSFVDPVALPYATGFDSAAQQAGWLFSGNNPTAMSFLNIAANAQSPAQYAAFNSVVAPAAANNNWLFSRPFNLAANEVVTPSFWYRTAAAGRSLRLTVGNSNTPAAQTTVIYTNTALPIATAYAQITAPTFTATTAGVYYFAFNDLTPVATAAATLRIDTVNFTSSVLSKASFASNSFSVYPNPTSNVLTISNGNGFNLKSVLVTDLNGRVVKEIKFNTVSDVNINMSDLAKGMYILNINSDLGSTVKKVIKE